MKFRFTPYTGEYFIEVEVAVIYGHLGKDPGLARYITERVSHRTRDVCQAIHVAQLCDTKEEMNRFESGVEPGRMFYPIPGHSRKAGATLPLT